MVLDELQTLFNISPLYAVKYVSAANWAHGQQMHDGERTEAASSR